MTIFDTIDKGDIDALKKYLDKKPDLSKPNKYGFTPLHCVATANTLELSVIMEMLQLLIDAGAPLEQPSKDGRTPLYLLAEFSWHLEPVKLLIDAGANPNVYGHEGSVHITAIAEEEEVKELLSKLTGVALEEEPDLGPEPVKMKTSAWKAAKSDLDKLFDKLNNAGLVALQDAGYTQSDGFQDCVEVYHTRKDKDSIIGFCFYTVQDSDRAKKSSELLLGIWGAPEGGDKETIAVGQLVVKTFIDAGFHVIWPENASTRPLVYLHKYS